MGQYKDKVKDNKYITRNMVEECYNKFCKLMNNFDRDAFLMVNADPASCPFVIWYINVSINLLNDNRWRDEDIYQNSKEILQYYYGVIADHFSYRYDPDKDEFIYFPMGYVLEIDDLMEMPLDLFYKFEDFLWCAYAEYDYPEDYDPEIVQKLISIVKHSGPKYNIKENNKAFKEFYECLDAYRNVLER